MKKISLLLIIMAGIAFLLPVSCVREEISQEELTGRELILDIGVDGLSTRAAGDQVEDNSALMEDALDWVDIFVSGVFKQGNSQAQGVKKFHMTKEDDMTSDDKWLLSADWRDDGFIEGEQYQVYVAANSKKIQNGNSYSAGVGSLNLTGITTLAGLQSALQGAVEYDYDPTVPNGEGGTRPFWGAHNDDKLNPEWLELHKKYISTPMVSGMTEAQVRQRRFYTNGKSFLMDGACSFTCGASQATSITLRRAAAKINMTVRFDKSFLNTLQKSPSGAPAWQFVNFAFSTPVFDTEHLGGSASLYDDHSIFTAGAIMMSLSGDTDLQYGSAPGQEDQTGYEFHFSTYSYPLEWADESGDAGVPGVIISVVYKQDPTNNNEEGVIQYYKIPVVDPALSQTGVKSIDRNKVYEVIATISSEGGDLLTDAYQVNCQFNIMDWGEIVNSQEVDNAANRYYFTVTPTNIVLRGDEMQTAEIKIVKPEGTNIGLQYWVMRDATVEKPFYDGSTNTRTDYTFDANNVAQNAPAPYYFNYAGTRRTIFNQELSRGGTVFGNNTYIQNKFTRSPKQDKLTLESVALPNKGVKYMKIRVYLVENPNLFQDITIRHYPTDYITAIEGSWASRKSAAAALDASDIYYRADNDANRGPEEYCYDTEYTHFREVYNQWEDDGTKQISSGTVDSDFSEYTKGKNGPYPDDFTITYLSSSKAEYFQNQASATPDPNYRRDREEYNYYFRNNSVSGVSDVLTQNNSYVNNSANRPGLNEENSIGPITEGANQWYYWGAGTPEVVFVTEEIRTTSSIRRDPQLSDFSLPNVQDYDYFMTTSLRSERVSQYSSYYYYYAVFTYYRYPKHYRAKNYQKPKYTCKQFSHDGYGPNSAYLALTSNTTASGDSWANIQRRKKRWVNWDKDQSNGSNVRVNSNGYQSSSDANDQNYRPFSARNYVSSAMHIIRQTTSNGIQSGRTLANMNQHIYILRFSQSSSDFTIGHPNLDSKQLSKDAVVAPALMIASQLGGTQTMPTVGYAAGNSNTREDHGSKNVKDAYELLYWEARHCATYLEVGNEGIMESSNRKRYYFDWRLPTEAEIKEILAYQSVSSESITIGGTTINGVAEIDGVTIAGDDRVLTPVLTSGFYRALNGQNVPNPHPLANTENIYTVRCVRELTMEEIELLENL